MFNQKKYRWRRQVMRCGIWNVIYRFFFKVHVEGWENIPADGPVVMMGNHVNIIDPVAMISFFPDRDIVPLAKLEAFGQPLIRYFVRHWGAISINRGEADLTALKTAIECLQSNYIVMLYAEGHRSKTGMIQGQEGSVYIALKTDALVVPVAVWGTEKFPVGWLKSFEHMPVYVRFGKPFRIKHEGGRLPREHFRAMTDEAMYRIAELLPPEWRGVYSDLSQATVEHLDFDVTWQPSAQQLPSSVLLPAQALQF